MVSKLLPSNVHTCERVARVLRGLGLLSLTVVGPRMPAGAIGLLPLVTGLLGTCPADVAGRVHRHAAEPVP